MDIGSATMATLDALAFEGATKRSKPNLKVNTCPTAKSPAVCVQLTEIFGRSGLSCMLECHSLRAIWTQSSNALTRRRANLMVLGS